MKVNVLNPMTLNDGQYRVRNKVIKTRCTTSNEFIKKKYEDNSQCAMNLID